jgi:isopenicillin-N N-acyltransferase like protein
MKKITFLLLLCCVLATTTVTFAAGKTQKKVPVVSLSGNAYQRGFQHGVQLRTAIAEVYKKWKASIHKDTGKDPDAVIADFLRSSDYKTAIGKYTPALWQEIQGMAAGSGQTVDDVLAFQLIDEYWGYLDRLKNGSVAKEHCSAIGVAATKGYPTFIAQNIDIDSFMHGYQVLLHIVASEDVPEQYIMSCAGFLGFAGMNNSGVGVVINALTDLSSEPEGLPVAFVTRGILNQNSGEEALDFVKNVKHATGQNYLIGTNHEVVNLEASATSIVPFYPVANKHVVFHTNHALANHDVKPWKQEYHARILAGTMPHTNSQKRFNALETRLSGPETILTPEVVQATLRSKDDPKGPVCVAFDKKAASFTFSSVLFTFGRKPSVQVTYGSPDIADYHEYFFEQII